MLYRLLCLTLLLSMVKCDTVTFSTDECLSAHNELRTLHENTNNLVYSSVLENMAALAARSYEQRDSDTTDVRPTRVLPKRRRRHIDDDTKHLEEWDGDIYYPKSRRDINAGEAIRRGESIHKFCCTSFPHCPKQFFHNLHFPPSAAGVVKDWYNEEIGSYDFQSGDKKTQFSQVSEFASIVWQNTTKIGCAQSRVSGSGCVYTVVVYEGEGAFGTPADFKNNIGSLITETDESSDTILTVFLILFFIALFITLIVLCYCCRHNIQDKMVEIRIKTDTMKAEQELETDSTSFWWLRIFKFSKKPHRRQTVSRPKKVPLTERPSIEIVPNSAPIRTIRPSQRIRGDSVNASYVRYHGISKKAETMTVQDNYGYDNGFNRPSQPKPYESGSHNKAVRQPSLSGKAAPPEPPATEIPIYGNVNPIPVTPPTKPPPLKPIPPKPTNQPPLHPTPPLKPVTKQPSAPHTAIKPKTAEKPTTPSGTKKLPMMPGARKSPGTAPRPSSSPVSQPTKPKPVPRKNTAPIEQTDSSSNVSTKPKPMMPPPRR